MFILILKKNDSVNDYQAVQIHNKQKFWEDDE